MSTSGPPDPLTRARRRLVDTWIVVRERAAAARATWEPRFRGGWARARAGWARARHGSTSAWERLEPRLRAGGTALHRGLARGWRDLPTWSRQGVRALATLLVVGLLMVVLLPLFAVPVVGLMARAVDVHPATADIDDLPALAERSVVLDAAGDTLAVLHDEVDRHVVPLDDIPEHVQQAVIAAEDRRFYEHEGFDARAIARAVLANLRAGGVAQGASTITQQVARQAYLDRDQTLHRKVEEVAHAVALEEHFDKREILERYLNEVYFGSGVYGIAAAAEEYFRADPDELTVDQAALLAGMIRAPERLSPREHPEQAETRRDQVLAAMAEEGFVDAGEAERLSDEPVQVEEPLEREVDAPYALEAVKREFVALEALGDSRDERIEKLFAGGVVVHTTLDRRLQQLADEVVAEFFPDGEGPTAALASLDPRSGAIRALHGGVDFEETQFDLATQGRRQPGSALKPFIAAAALAHGLSPNAAFEGNGPLAFTLGDDDEPWEVNNFGGSSHGRIGLRQATVGSVNTAFAQLVLAVGPEETVEMAERLGVDAEAAFGPPETWGPSIVLGGLTHGVTPLELAGAYGAFADEGRLGAPFLIERVEDAAGEVLYERDTGDREQVLDPGVNAAMVDILRGVVEEGTGTAAALGGWQVVGKTGTTDDYTDAWFAGATSLLSTAVWVGHPEEQISMGEMTGGSVPAQLWHTFMAGALDGVEPEPLPGQDAGELPAPASVSVPDLTGMPIGQALVEAANAGLTVIIADGDGADPTRPVALQQPSAGAAALFGDAVVVRFSVPEPDPPDEDDEDDDDDDEDEDDEDNGPPSDPPGRD